ncbi:MAG TPA: hypothetical protein VGF55_32555 [Gemmataceae bacterium]|jgi:hypothetical protein
MYRVEWLRSALNELAAIWTQADSAQRAAITAATQAIDEGLSADPYDKGESRERGVRVAFALPLGVTFRVAQVPDAVAVLHVWLVQKRRRQ